jgi:hypothetical protein
MLQELEGFTYANTLDLNMGYYTIIIDPTDAEMCTIIFPWGKYSYQRLPMGSAGLADIFQAEILDDHLDKLQQAFIRLRNAGLKINATKSIFCAQETEYLGYILTRDGIKPQPKKVQAILALNPPNKVKELQRFLGMVQYYRDI